MTDQCVGGFALAGTEGHLGLLAGLDEPARDPEADHLVLPALFVVGPLEETAPLEFLEPGLDLFLDLRVVPVALRHGVELPELLDTHGPGEPALPFGVHELVETLGHRALERKEEVGVERLEETGVVRTDEYFVELQDVALRGASLSLPRAREVYAPRGEAVGAKLLGLPVVEGVLGVDHAVCDPVQGLAHLLVIVAPAVLAEDLQKLVEAEAHLAVRRYAPSAVDQLHNPDVHVSLRRAR